MTSNLKWSQSIGAAGKGTDKQQRAPAEMIYILKIIKHNFPPKTCILQIEIYIRKQDSIKN